MQKCIILLSVIAFTLIGCGGGSNGSSKSKKSKNTSFHLPKTKAKCLTPTKTTEALLPPSQFPGLAKNPKPEIIVSGGGCVLEGSTPGLIKVKAGTDTAVVRIDYPDWALDKHNLDKISNFATEHGKSFDVNDLPKGGVLMNCMRAYSQQKGVKYKKKVGKDLYDIEFKASEIRNNKLVMEFEYEDDQCTLTGNDLTNFNIVNNNNRPGPTAISNTDFVYLFKTFILNSKSGSKLYKADKDVLADRVVEVYR